MTDRKTEPRTMTQDYCHRCCRVTPTRLLFLSSGHIGNLCADCRTTRKGRPFVSKVEFHELQNAPMPKRAEGDHETQKALR
jgi:hypothetical protein